MAEQKLLIIKIIIILIECFSFSRCIVDNLKGTSTYSPSKSIEIMRPPPPPPLFWALYTEDRPENRISAFISKQLGTSCAEQLSSRMNLDIYRNIACQFTEKCIQPNWGVGGSSPCSKISNPKCHHQTAKTK